MQIKVTWNPDVSLKLQNLAICIGVVKGVSVREDNVHLYELVGNVYKEVRSRYEIDQLKENPTVRAYRDFYWNLGIDPTKTRPAGEALVRRALQNEEIIRISNVVDAYNLASLKTLIPISGFDLDRLSPRFHVRFAREGELFTGIGMRTAMLLSNKMVVLADNRQILSIYPYRDSENTKITLTSRNLVIVGYGAPRITSELLGEAVETAVSFIVAFAGGQKSETKTFQSTC